MKIVILVVYFGQWPVWFPAFLQSCRYNSTVNWLFFTDCPIPEPSIDNVAFIPFSIHDLNSLASSKLGYKITLLKPYKLCDFKPCYGLIFSEYIREYDFWGHCDVDIIWGQIRKFLTDDILLNHDVISARKKKLCGHFTLYRNNDFTKNLFRHDPNYQTILQSEKVFISAIAINGCTPHELTSQSATTLSLVTPVEPATFNYANNGWYPSVFVFNHDGLTRQNGVTGEIEPALAESWQFSRDNKQVIFTLRKDLKWSDGHPLTADDVVFTYNEIIFNPKVPIAAKDLLRIGEKREFPKVRKLDNRRIEFALPEPFSPFLQTTTGAQTNAIAIMPSHTLEKTLREKDSKGNLKFITTWGTDTDPKKVVVNGAYQLESYTTGQRLILKRNPYYWRKDHNGQTLPKVDRIIWHILENQDLQLLRFRSGDFDVLGDSRPIKPEYYALLKQTENRGNFRLLNGGAWSSVLQFFFNLNTGIDKQGRPFVDPVRSRWFNLKAFRQAIAYGIDQQRINTNIFRGLGIFYHSPIPQQSPFYLSPAQGLKTYPHNRAKAKELLLEAGFKYDNQGQLFDDQGNRVEFMLMTNVDNAARVAIGSQIKQDLAKIGINVNLQPINFSLLAEKLSSRRWEACMIGFESGVEPHLLASVWMSNGAAHLFNMSQHSLEPPTEGYTKKPFEVVIDQLFQQGAQEFDLAKRKKIYDQFQRIAQEELPILYLVNDRALMAARNDVQGLKYSGLASWGLWNIDELKLMGRTR